MKQYIILLLSTFLVYNVPQAQILKALGDKAKNKVLQRADNKVDNAMEKGLDGVEGAVKIKKDEDGDVKVKDENGKVKIKGDVSGSSEQTLQAYSKYDFVQGEKVIAFDDFSRANIGDFPTSWNTSASAEVVTLNSKEGKWLKINTQGAFYLEFIKSLPENSTLEFDLGVNPNFQWSTSNIHLFITSLQEKGQFANSGYYGPYFEIEFHPMIGSGSEHSNGGVNFRTNNSSTQISNTATIKNWNNKGNNFVHVSLWRQGQRLRMYANGDKIFDLPRVFDANGKYTDLIFTTHNFIEPDFYVLGNFRLASGAPDTRNKLLTEGKFVTSGITFDINSDKIKPESAGVLKEIAGVLSENPDVKVKIIGHTDSDGDAAKNLDLSKRRAASVKAALSANYNIDASRMETDGMGASKPIADNKTPEGKAQNRRVEFVKM